MKPELWQKGHIESWLLMAKLLKVERDWLISHESVCPCWNGSKFSLSSEQYTCVKVLQEALKLHAFSILKSFLLGIRLLTSNILERLKVYIEHNSTAGHKLSYAQAKCKVSSYLRASSRGAFVSR